MKGYVETPTMIVDLMVNKLFRNREPSRESKVLDPGCGTGAFIEGIIRWCRQHKVPFPNIIGVESDPRHVPKAVTKFEQYSSVSIQQRDFLAPEDTEYDYIIGNPPYVPITKLTEKEKRNYRALYETAKGRFDLYLLFFERALQSLRPGARLVFITPEKFLYVETARPLRKLLSTNQVEEIHLLNEDVFGELVTYPTITTVTNNLGPYETMLILRDGQTACVNFPADGSSWLPYVRGEQTLQSEYRLEDICKRISCGVATGADSVFVKEVGGLNRTLRRFAYPTLAGRELTSATRSPSLRHTMLIPYTRDGQLMDPKGLGSFMDYLSQPEVRNRLERRTCVSRKPWYAFHENPPLYDILQPKILCKDITTKPHFWIDRKGTIVPRHSVYYIVPKDPSRIDEIAEYLNSRVARRWLENHCQGAANGFLRLQSHVLKQLPISRRLKERSVIPILRGHQVSSR